MDRTEIINLLRNFLLEIVPELDGELVEERESLRDLGANSVDRGELITLTLEKLKLDIPRVELAGAQTLAEIADALVEKLRIDQNRILNIIAGHLEEMIPDLSKSDVNESSLLCLLGASSVDQAELIERMREELKLKTDHFYFHSANNLGELSEMLFSCYVRERSANGYVTS